MPHIWSFMFSSLSIRTIGFIMNNLHFCRAPPKISSNEKEKVGSTSSTARTREPKGGLLRFLNPENTARCSNIISHWTTLSERSVKLDGFLEFELVNLAQIWEWEKVVK